MARTPAIPMDNPFRGNLEAEGSVYQYHTVIPGSDDHQVKPQAAGAVGDGTIIAGVAQYDQTNGHSVAMVYAGQTWGYAVGIVSRDNPLTAVYNATVDGTNPGGGFSNCTGQTLVAGKMIAGIALEDAADGERFKVFLTRHVQVKES